MALLLLLAAVEPTADVPVGVVAIVTALIAGPFSALITWTQTRAKGKAEVEQVGANAQQAVADAAERITRTASALIGQLHDEVEASRKEIAWLRSEIARLERVIATHKNCFMEGN